MAHTEAIRRLPAAEAELIRQSLISAGERLAKPAIIQHRTQNSVGGNIRVGGPNDHECHPTKGKGFR